MSYMLYFSFCKMMNILKTNCRHWFDYENYAWDLHIHMYNIEICPQEQGTDDISSSFTEQCY